MRLIIITYRYLFLLVYIALLNPNKAISQASDFESKNIEKVVFKKEGYANNPEYEIVIYADRTIVLNAIRDNYKDAPTGDIIPFGVDSNGTNIRDTELKGIFKATLGSKELKKVFALIGELDKEFEEQNFTSKELHSSSGWLKVVYHKNQMRSIYDIGLEGSDALVELYDFLDKLKEEKNWK